MSAQIMYTTMAANQHFLFVSTAPFFLMVKLIYRILPSISYLHHSLPTFDILVIDFKVYEGSFTPIFCTKIPSHLSKLLHLPKNEQRRVLLMTNFSYSNLSPRKEIPKRKMLPTNYHFWPRRRKIIFLKSYLHFNAFH